jgi:hypothetical protein
LCTIYKVINNINKNKIMKKLILIAVVATLLFSCNTNTKPETVEDLKSGKIVKLHEGAFAFCGASAAVPTGRKITVQGVVYDEGCAICPVLSGPSLSNLAMEGSGGTYGDFNINNNFQTPDGTDKTVWSLFWYYDASTTIPQFNPATKSWELLPPVNRSFEINLDSPATSESNMFAMPGVIIDTTDSGIVLAKVYGPLNEAAVPLRVAVPVKNGQTSVTAAKIGFPYPVGTPIPVAEYSKELQSKNKE